MKEIALNSGAKLGVGEVPWEEAFKLFQMIVKSMKSVEVDPTIKNLSEFISALIGAQIADDEVGKAMWVCLGRCTYGGTRITKSTFEDMKARGDFIDVCIEAGREILNPFMKGLYVALPRLTEMIINTRKPK